MQYWPAWHDRRHAFKSLPEFESIPASATPLLWILSHGMIVNDGNPAFRSHSALSLLGSEPNPSLLGPEPNPSLLGSEPNPSLYLGSGPNPSLLGSGHNPSLLGSEGSEP
jgi:hypothetical protein